MNHLIALLIPHLSTALWSGASATSAVVVNKLWFSPKEKKIEHRDDFRAVTDSLFKELNSLREDVNKHKEDSVSCEDKYNDLQQRFIEFKSKYNELELRYQIQVNLNKKISEEIRNLEAQIQARLNNETNEQTTGNTTSSGSSE